MPRPRPMKAHFYPVERKTPSFRGGISDLAGSLLLVNVLFEDADWSSTTRSCEVGGRPQSALPIPLHQIGPFLSEHSADTPFRELTSEDTETLGGYWISRWTWLSSRSISTRVVSKSVQTLANIILRLSTALPSNTR